MLPLLATQILWINLITDSAPALAMGVDPTIDDVMARRPRRPTDRVIDATHVGRRRSAIGAVMAVVTLLTIDLYLPGGLIEGSRDFDNARTAAFTTLVLRAALQLLQRPLGGRQRLPSPVRQRVAVGRGRVVGVAAGGGGPPADSSTSPSARCRWTPTQWLVCAAMASAVLWFSEIRKAILR